MIILTGASGGIGLEMLGGLSKLDDVCGIYNSNKPDKANVTFTQVDITNPVAITKFVLDLLPTRITLIHMAASKLDGLVVNYEEESWDTMVKTNLKGNFLLTKALLPTMLADKFGRIIHITSSGLFDVGTYAYSATKCALLGMSKTLGKEYAKWGITSNVLSLGYFDAGLYRRLSDTKKLQLIGQIPSKKLGNVSNIVNAVEFIMKSEFVNGSVVAIDGCI